MIFTFILSLAFTVLRVNATANSDNLHQSIYPTVIFPRVFDPIASSALETPIQIRCFFYINTAVWNAWSNYHPTAVDIFGRSHFRRPLHEHTTENKNIAIMYSIFRIYQSSPASFGGDSKMMEFRKIIREQGRNPDDTSLNMSSPVGIGNREGYDLARLMKIDGWNAQGDHTVRQSLYRIPFMDYTNYTPKNNPWQLKYPFKWQPVLESNAKGFFFRQEHVSPQARKGMMFSFTKDELSKRTVPPLYGNSSAKTGSERASDLKYIRKLARHTISHSANLNIRKQIIAEYMDNKVKSFKTSENPGGQLSIAAAIRFNVLPRYYDWNMDDDIIYGMAANILSLDATVITWKEKVRNDNVRPTGQTMQHLFGDRAFRVWGGPGKLPIFINAKTWQPYIRTMPHSEYPSGSACLCSSLVEHALVYTNGKNNLPFEVTIPKGSSQFYPGKVPPRDFKLRVPHLKAWSKLCGESRLWAGVHFRPSIKSSVKLCRGVGRRAQDVVDNLLAGRQSLTWQEWFPASEEKFWEM